ncbi:MAG: site-specific DNA-methyltransferase [Phycisphaerales bacterium]
MRIETHPISSLNPAPYNPRVALKPGDPDYERLSRSIDEFGCVEPLVWNQRTGNLVGGHQRLAVLKARGATEVDVSVVDLPPDKEKALNLALNKIAGRWDESALASLLDDLLKTPELDFDLTGFDVAEARSLIDEFLPPPESAFADPDAFDPDALAPPGAAPVTQLGDLITLGTDPRTAHRLLCGDSTNAESVQSLMQGERAALFATDPPYLVGYDGSNHPGSTRNTRGKNWSSKSVGPGGYGETWDDDSGDPALYRGFIGAAIAHALRDDAAWYCWHASRRQAMLEQVWIEFGAFVHCQIIWTKSRSVPTRTWYLWGHEPCLFGWKKGHRPPRAVNDKLSTVWDLPSTFEGEQRPDHPTPKPIAAFEIPMRQHTRGGIGEKPADICYEPFAGSGTQIVAAQRLGRRCFAMEISPRYCDLVVRRFIALFGERAVAPEVAEKYRFPGFAPAPVNEEAA